MSIFLLSFWQTPYKPVSKMGGVGVACLLMVFTAVLNQVYMLLEFNRQNCVYSSAC